MRWYPENCPESSYYEVSGIESAKKSVFHFLLCVDPSLPDPPNPPKWKFPTDFARRLMGTTHTTAQV